MPDELPPNVQPTAGVLLAQATEEQKFNKPLDAVSSEFFSAGAKPGRAAGETAGAESRLGAGDQAARPVADQRQDQHVHQHGRGRGGSFQRYQARSNRRRQKHRREPLRSGSRRWLGDKPAEWTDQVTGAPSFFSLETVDLLTAGKSLIVFDKQNNELFQAQLSYPISARFTGRIPFTGPPAVERAGVLYFFDQGVLTAFSLPGGQVQWRLTSIGISRAQFDPDGLMYIDSTAAARRTFNIPSKSNSKPRPR